MPNSTRGPMPSPMSSPVQDLVLRLATWNIHAGVGTDGSYRPERIAGVLCELEGHVVALQEVEHRPAGGEDMLDYLAAESALTGIAGPTLLKEGRHYGNALLSGLPVLAVNRVDLSLDRREPRGALDVLLDWRGRRLQVVATHLGLRPFERRRQVRALLALFEERQADVAVLMGDLNEWLLWGRPLRWLRGHFAPTPHVRTFPARLPMLALDRIWVQPRHCLARLRAHRTPLARAASDHLPLTAMLRDEEPVHAASSDA